MNYSLWQRLKSHYDSAMDLSGASRRAYVAKLGPGNLASELGRLLGSEESFNGFLEQPVFEEGVKSSAVAHTFIVGNILNGRYEIGEFVGSGGMGEVFRAFDRDIRQWIALKTLRPEFVSHPALIAKLRKEIQLARRVTHPNICRLFDMGRSQIASDTEVVFFTMELLDGKTLADVIRKSPLTSEEAVQIASQLSAGLAAAHTAGIIHRDLKSSNIILTSNPTGAMRAVITDFGLAREQKAPINETISAFGPNAIVGTPAYMAPEQLEGGEVTAASDIYSLGVVLFEMISGRLPIENSSPLVIALRRISEPAPDVRKYVPDVPAKWVAVIHACLERNPSRRPRSADAVGQMLRGEAHVRRRFSRRVVLVSAGGGVALAAGLPFFLLNRQTRVAPEARKHYELGQEFAKRRTRENLANAIKEYESALKIEAKFGDAWSGLADAYSAMANYNFMQPSAGLNKAREAATRAVRLNPDSGRANGVMAYIISIDVRRWLEAGPHFERAVHLDPLESVVRLWYGAWLGKRGQFNAALSQLNIGLERDPASFNLHHQRAIEYFRAKHFTEFLIEAREVVRLQPYEASSHLSLARALEWTGRLEEARASCGDAEKYGNGPAAMCGRACVEARGGNLQLAKRMEEEVYEYWNANPFETLSLAQLCSLLEGPKEVFAILGAGYERGDSTVLGSPASPYFDKWHQEPGFRELNRKLGLPA